MITLKSITTAPQFPNLVTIVYNVHGQFPPEHPRSGSGYEMDVKTLVQNGRCEMTVDFGTIRRDSVDACLDALVENLGVLQAALKDRKAVGTTIPLFQ